MYRPTHENRIAVARPIGQAPPAYLALIGLGLLLTPLIGCEPAFRCSRNSDCERVRGICSARGFCIHECTVDIDCPCGSFCAPSCGMCVRDDLAGAATCFARDQFYGEDDVQAACFRDMRVVSRIDGSTTDIDAGAREECSAVVAAPRCERTGLPEDDVGPDEVDAGLEEFGVDAGDDDSGG